MFCKKCGKELPDNAVFCSNCGYSVNAVNHETAGASPVSNNSDDSDSSNNGRHKKRWKVIIIILAVILVLAAVCAVLFFNIPAQKYKRQISLGEKYLDEMKYDEAVAAFTAAIKIEPTAEAYIGRAKAYAGNGDYEKADADCEKAKKLDPNDDELKEIDKIVNLKESDETSDSNEEEKAASQEDPSEQAVSTQAVSEAAEEQEAIADDGVYSEIKNYLDENNYPFQENFIVELDNDYSGYGTAAPWTDAGEYYEVEGYIFLSNPFVSAGSRNNNDDGAAELANTTINLCGHKLETGEPETLNRNKSVLDGVEKISGTGKAIPVKSIDGDADWDVCFLYGASETAKQPSYYDWFYDIPTVAEEAPDTYYWELCEADYEDTEGNLPDITGAWFTHFLNIPTISEQKKTIRIRKDAVFAIADSDNPDNPYMATMQDIYEGKGNLSSSEWSLYQWFAPNEYGFSPMCRMRITFDTDGLVKEVVPMLLND